MSNSDVGAVVNSAGDYPSHSQPTYPVPPGKRKCRRPPDSKAQQAKTKPLGDAVHVSQDSSSRSSALLESGGQKETRGHCSGSEETLGRIGSNNRQDMDDASLPTFDASMRVIWSGQVAVNGSEICSAELMSRCHIRNTM